jgi:hypothetical protein
MPVIALPSKVPEAVAFCVVSSVSQYKNAATMSEATAPFVLQGSVVHAPTPLVHGTPVIVMVPPLAPVPLRPTPAIV